MTAVATRVSPSPVPLHEQTVPRDVSRNPWVRHPDPSEFAALFGVELLAVDVPAELIEPNAG